MAVPDKRGALLLLLLIPAALGLNLGLIAGDLKRLSSPLVIKKISKHTPVFVNVNSGLTKPRTAMLPKLPPKPPPLKLIKQTKPSKKLPRSILTPKLPLLPILPILPPILPILPPLLPILPPILPLFPRLPKIPFVPTLLKLKAPLNRLRVPILKRPPPHLLGTKLKVTNVPPVTINKKSGIRDKLLDLKKKGSLTTAEYITFKKLLVK